MSGGSYNYICAKGDLGELYNYQADIQSMADRLAGLGYANDAARETQDLLLTLRQFENRISAMHARLSDVWKAVEWWDSCDSGENGVKIALEKYRNRT